MQVPEDVLRDLPDGVLRHPGEDGVSQLVESRCAGPGHAVPDQQGEDRRGHRLLRAPVQLQPFARQPVQAVHRVLEHEGHRDVEQLGPHQQTKGDHHRPTHT